MSKIYDETSAVTLAEDAMRPAGLTEEEWRCVLNIRALKAEEQRQIALWREAFGELVEDPPNDLDEEDWIAVGQQLRDRLTEIGWDGDVIDDFTKGWLRANEWTPEEIRNHGEVWKAPGSRGTL